MARLRPEVAVTGRVTLRAGASSGTEPRSVVPARGVLCAVMLLCPERGRKDSCAWELASWRPVQGMGTAPPGLAVLFSLHSLGSLPVQGEYSQHLLFAGLRASSAWRPSLHWGRASLVWSSLGFPVLWRKWKREASSSLGYGSRGGGLEGR